jgi:mono/diheme cytochrome c family protein/cytochrome c553
MTPRISVSIRVGLALFVAVAPASSRADDPPPDPAKVEFFESKIRPLLADRCFECHGADKQKAGLRLDTPDAMLGGGDSGPAVVPGNPDESLLVEAIRYDGPYKMPPKGKLSDAEVAALTDWVKMGAPWPDSRGPQPAPTPTHAGPRPITEDESAFWSFRPIADPPVPIVRDAAWPRTTIDRFILSSLESAGLRPAPPAEKRTLIRRATFDLIGLPPTPEEVEAFVADEAPDAYERLVDRLLASPHYGERWGRHWLDIARYGEDQAHSFKPRLYPNGFRYRDWIASALNADMPYDRFVVEQVAADLLDEPGRRERLPALGFFACGPVYYGDAKGFDQIDDRIDTMARGFLGLTVACARCHDHKYDPIRQADYYALAGVIGSTQYDETPIAPPEEVEAYQRSQAEIAAKDREIAALLDDEASRLAESQAREVAHYLVAAWKLRNRRAEDPAVDAERIAREEGLEAKSLDRWAGYLARRDGERPHLAAWFSLLDRREPAACLATDADAIREVEEVAREFQARALAVVASREPVESPKDAGTGGDASEKKADKALRDELIGEKGPLAVPRQRVEKVMSGESRARLAAMRSDLDRIKSQAPSMYPVAHALKEGKPKDMRILLRGNPDMPGPEVPRRFLAVLGGETFAEGSGRLELARAIASPDNPLTARVMVNRVWQHHFGRGLVGTASNFGRLGEPPSHPELLDHLARRFIDSGWSIKSLHRAIMLSAVYRQGGGDDPRAVELDPENRLLWRMDRRRLEVEAWRDAMLAVSGRLDPALGGPSSGLDDAENRRRTFYAAVSRHDLHPMLRLFDFPDPNITSGERTRTNVPLQQLFVLNDEFLVLSARGLASTLTGPDDARIRRAYALLFGRPPSDAELRLGLSYLGVVSAEGQGEDDLSRWERYAQVLLGTNEFLYVD